MKFLEMLMIVGVIIFGIGAIILAGAGLVPSLNIVKYGWLLVALGAATAIGSFLLVKK